jgi:hypothetical protein
MRAERFRRTNSVAALSAIAPAVTAFVKVISSLERLTSNVLTEVVTP